MISNIDIAIADIPVRMPFRPINLVNGNKSKDLTAPIHNKKKGPFSFEKRPLYNF